jgi:hypothetical protein
MAARNRIQRSLAVTCTAPPSAAVNPRDTSARAEVEHAARPHDLGMVEHVAGQAPEPPGQRTRRAAVAPPRRTLPTPPHGRVLLARWSRISGTSGQPPPSCARDEPPRRSSQHDEVREPLQLRVAAPRTASARARTAPGALPSARAPRAPPCRGALPVRSDRARRRTAGASLVTLVDATVAHAHEYARTAPTSPVLKMLHKSAFAAASPDRGAR